MAKAEKYVQVEIPRINAYPPFRVPEAATNALAMLSLNDMGVIQKCCRTSEQLFGYRQDELGGCHVSRLLPHLEDADLVQEGRINSRLAFLCHCATPFQARHRDGNIFSSELFINRLGIQNVVVLVRSLEGKR